MLKGKLELSTAYVNLLSAKLSRRSFLSLVIGAIFLISVLSVVSSFSFAQTPTFSTPINISNDNGNARFPNVQNNGTNVYVSWTEQSGGILFRASSNGGTSWNPPTSSAALKLSLKGGVASYPLMAEYGSYIYVVWSQTPKSSSPAQIYLAVSSNNGGSFSTAILVDSDSTVAQTTPVIAAWGSTVYVAWAQNSQSWLASSTNNGASFGKAMQYSSKHEPQLAAAGSDGYAIADGNAIYVTANNGGSWTKTTISGCCGAEPWIMASGSNVIASWETKSNASEIEAVSSQNSGKTWSKPVVLSTGVADSWAPMVGIQGNNAVIAWRTNPGGTLSQEYLVTSSNAGMSWTAPVNIGITNRINAWPFTVTISGNTAYTMWSEKVNSVSSSTAWQTLAVEGTLSGNTWTWSSPVSLTGSNPTFGAQPEQDIATGAISSSSSGAYAVWQNNATSSQIYFSTS